MPNLLKVRHLLPRSQQRLLSLLKSDPSELDDSDNDDTDEFPDLQIAYRKPALVSTECIDSPNASDNLSDYIVVRLAVARARAMEKYRKING
jgi:hypothetical protein